MSTTYELPRQVKSGPTQGQWCIQWQSAQMAAPAFTYFETLEQATDYINLEPEAYRRKWLK